MISKDSLGGKSSYINGFPKPVPPAKKKRKGLKNLLVSMIVLLTILSGIYVMSFGENNNSTESNSVYALVELKTPGTLRELKDSGVEIVHIYGYYALIRYDPTKTLRGLSVEPLKYDLLFQTGRFAGVKDIPSEMSIDMQSTNLYIVQFIGPATPSWLQQIKAYGKIYKYYHNYAYLVKMKYGEALTVKDLFYVKEVYPYEPLWKMYRSLYQEMNSGNATVLKLRINVDPELNIEYIANELATEYGAKIIKYFRYTKYNIAYVVAEVEKTKVIHILRENYVLSADIEHEIHLMNSVAARIIGAAELRDSWRNGLGLPVTGDGQVVAIADTGLDTGNPNTVMADFAGRVLTIYDAAGDGDPSDPDNGDLGGHGTHVAGSVASSGIMSGADPANHYYSNSFAGMAPEAQIHFESIGTVSNGQGGLNYDSITNMADRSYNDGARIWTNSWGTSDNSYASSSDEVDTYMWNHKDFLILFAAGNSGPGPNTVGAPATAKNIITVGATETLRFEVNSQGTFNAYSMAQNPEQLAYFSSRGPTADGLIKPDVCAPGAGIVSDRPTTLSDSNAVYTWIVPIDYNGDGKYDYGAMQGTSMATPVTAGAMVLVRDYYVDVEGLSNPSAALIKATAIGGAQPMPGYKYGGIDQGYGRINIARALIPNPPLSYRYWDWKYVDNGASWTQTIDVKTDEAPLRIVLVWTDVNSGNGAGIAQNNLNLRVIAPDGTEYHGNMFVGDSQWSTQNPASYDNTNVVEVVNVEKPMVGTWTIEVIGANIGTDDPDGPGSLDQTFAVYALGPFGPQNVGNVRVERFSEITYGNAELKGFTHLPIQKVIVPGQSVMIPFRVVNWGPSTLEYSVQTNIVPSTNYITVSYDETSITLNSGEIRWINATIHASPGISAGLYKVRLEAYNSTYGYTDSIVVNLVVPTENPLWHKKITNTDLNEVSSAIKIDPSDGSIWVAYFRQNESTTGNIHYSNNGNGDSYDLIIAHSTDGGKTWVEYIAYPNIDRFYNYGGSLEQVMDWFSWYPRMDIDSNGEVFVAFSNVTSLVVVYGNESGWSHTSFESGSYQQVGGSWISPEYRITMVYPMFDIKATGAGQVHIVYTYRYYDFTRNLIGGSITVNGAFRALKHVYTTDGGNSWSSPAYIGSYTTSDTNDEREYFPSLVYDGSSLYAFFSFRNPANSENNYYIRYYKYSSGSWSSATTIYGTGTDGGNDLQPSAFIDSSGKIWVAWYSEDDGQNSHFGVTEHKIYLMYSSDGGSSWNGPIKIDSAVPGLDINDYGPVPIGEDSSGNILIGFAEENSYYTSAPYNENWVHYRYSIKMAIINPNTADISGYKYIDYGGQPNYWLAGDSYNGVMYFTYTKTHERYKLDIFFAKYGGNIADDIGPITFGTMVYPYNTNNATKIIYVDLVYIKNLTLAATLSDVESGNSDIETAEYFVDSIGNDGTGTALNAKDGAYDSPTEVAIIKIDPFSLTRGYHRIYVHAKDSAGNWGPYDYIDIYIFASKFKVYGWVNDSAGNPLSNIAVNITDKNTGENVTVYTNANGYYEYYIDQLPHAYSVGDTILVYADDGTNPAIMDGTYYDTNSTAISTAPGGAKLNLQLSTPVPEMTNFIVVLLGLLIATLIIKKHKTQ